MRLRTDSYIVTGSIGVSGDFFFPVARPLVVEVLPGDGTLPVPFVALAGFGGAELMPLKVGWVYLELFVPFSPSRSLLMCAAAFAACESDSEKFMTDPQTIRNATSSSKWF